MRTCCFLVLRMKQEQRSTTLNHFPHTLLKEGRQALSILLHATWKVLRSLPSLNLGNHWGDTLFAFRPYHTVLFVLFSGYFIHETQTNIPPLPCSTSLFSHSLTGKKNFRKAFLILLLFATACIRLRRETKLNTFSAPMHGDRGTPT